MNIIFMGNSEFGVPVLKALANHSRFKPVAVVTNPPKPMGRGRNLSETPIGIAARNAEIKMLQPSYLKDQSFINDLEELNPDLFVVVAYRILPKEVLSLPSIGSINLHGSLLPEYRGAAPIQRAIMDGKTVTGLTTFIIDPKVDTGAVLLKTSFPIDIDDDYGSIAEKMSLEGPEIVIRSIQGLLDKTITPEVQDHSLATQAPKIKVEDRSIQWNRSSAEIHNQVRALSPSPGAHAVLGRKRFKILKTEVPADAGLHLVPGELSIGPDKLLVGTGSGTVSILEIQREGGKKLNIIEFLKGFQFQGTQRFN